MWRQKVACCIGLAALVLAAAERPRAAENFAVKTFVPTFNGPDSLGANVSTILALRLWATLRPRPRPNPDNLYFGVGQIEWSRRTIEEPQAALQAGTDTGSQLVLWGDAREYGPGVIVASNLVVPPSEGSARARQTWTVAVKDASMELGLPGARYQFSPLIISNDVVAKYSRPNQVRVCETKLADCAGALLGNPFRADRIEGNFAFVRQPGGATGWVSLPNLSASQSEVIGFTAALISYFRGDFEQAESFFSNVRDGKPAPGQDTREYRSESLVRNDASLLAGVSKFRRGQDIEALRSAHAQNRYSRYAVQALVMANIALAASPRVGNAKASHVKEASDLVESYRDLFPPDDPWLGSADRSLRNLN
jgi:hypothetical protein